MRKILLLMGILFLLSFCFHAKIRLLPYPEGIIFPVEQTSDIAYEGEIAGEIFQEKEFLFFATWGGDIFCLESSNRNLQWTIQIGEPLIAPLNLSEEFLFAADQTNTLHCLDLRGNRRWQNTIGSKITGPAARIGEAVCFGTEEGQLVALNRNDGREIWRYSAGMAVRSNPVAIEGGIVFGCDDHFLYILDKNGSFVARFEMEDRIGATLGLDGQFLYFGLENGSVICFDLKREIIRWKIRTRGILSYSPIVVKNRVYFLTWNNVLYCVHRITGSILWWKAIPSRIPFRLLIVKDRIVVSSLSSTLICLDGETGNTLGQADVGGEMKSNALWIPPHLLVCVFDKELGKEKLVVMKKQVKIALSASLEPPQVVNTEILFSAEAVGFHQPQFEFFVIEAETRKTVQEGSEKSRWAWFPSEPGAYRIGVAVQDERQAAEIEIPFVIEKEKPLVSLSSSSSSPLRAKSDILFSVSSTGLTEPEYRFQILHLIRIPFGTGGYFLLEEKNNGDVIRESPETENWIWSPQTEGLFLVHVVASDSAGKAETAKYFLISKGKN
jgi:outer membrane protein assembly factor BamB